MSKTGKKTKIIFKFDMHVPGEPFPRYMGIIEVDPGPHIFERASAKASAENPKFEIRNLRLA